MKPPLHTQGNRHLHAMLSHLGHQRPWSLHFVKFCDKYHNFAQCCPRSGPLSTQQPDGIVPINTAIAPLKDMGGCSVKLFPMGGLACRDEYQAMAEACARHGFWLEPTLENFEEIVLIALGAGVQKVLPHVYSSIIDR